MIVGQDGLGVEREDLHCLFRHIGGLFEQLRVFGIVQKDAISATFSLRAFISSCLFVT